MKPRFTMRAALSDPMLLGSILPGPSWQRWRTLLVGAMGEQLTEDERTIFRTLTGREREPGQRVDELWAVVGRRGGKTRAAAVLSVYLAALVDHRDRLSLGERGKVVFLAQNARTAGVAFEYATAIFDAVPILAQLVRNKTSDTLTLTNGVDLEVRASSFRGLRGITCVGCVVDELAYFYSEDSANPDAEILASIRPTLATTSGPLVCISSPYARRGEMWNAYDRHFGAKGDPIILVAQGGSTVFNPALPQSVVDRALERDPIGNRAEYLAEFRTDCEAFVTIEAVRACVSPGIFERAPSLPTDYRAWCDPSGGRSDGMTLAIAHRDGDKAVLDLVREVPPPFSPEQVVREFCDLLKLYRLDRVTGDQYAADWCREQFRKYNVFYRPAEKSKSDIFLDFLPAINSALVDLIDHPKLVAQLVALERKPGRTKDVIDHARDAHDDIANAAAGALTCVLNRKRWETLTPVAGPISFNEKGERIISPVGSGGGFSYISTCGVGTVGGVHHLGRTVGPGGYVIPRRDELT
jgi:hypothetical protein